MGAPESTVESTAQFANLHDLLSYYYCHQVDELEKNMRMVLEEISRAIDKGEDVDAETRLYVDCFNKLDEYPPEIKKIVYIGVLYWFNYRTYMVKYSSPDSKIDVVKFTVDVPPGLVEVDRERNRVSINYFGLAEFIARKFCVVRYSNAIYIYDGRKYVEVDKDGINSIIQRVLLSAGFPRTRRFTEYVREIRKSLFSTSGVAKYPFDKLTNFIPVLNGVLWVKEDGSVELLPHSPLFGFTYIIPVKYDPNADCPNIKNFLQSLVNDEESLEILYEIPASCLTRTTSFQYAYFLYGTGANGKSTYLNLVRKLLGEDNVSSVSLHDLCRSRFRAACLIGKLANIYPDLSGVGLVSVDTLKALTGDDTITVEKKFMHPFSFHNTARLIFSANEFPKVKKDDDAFWRRWIIVKFPNKFKANPHLFKKISTDEELSGFLNEVLKRLPKILNCTPTIVEDAKKEWIRHSDSLKAFYMDCIKMDNTSTISANDLYRAYCDYCDLRNLEPVSMRKFGEFMTRYAKKKKTKQGIVYVGIRVVPIDEVDEVDMNASNEYNLIISDQANVRPMSDSERIMSYLSSETSSDAEDLIDNSENLKYVKLKLIKLPVGTDRVVFTGVDGEVYSIGLGDVVEVPEENARPMLDKGYAMRVG